MKVFFFSLFFWKALIMIFLCCTYGVTEKEERSFIFEGGGGGAEGCNKKYRKFARLLVSWRRIYPKNVIFIFFTKSPLFCMLHNFYAPYKKITLKIKSKCQNRCQSMSVHIISSIKDDDNIKIHTFLQHVNMLLREYLKALFAWYTKYSCEKSKGLISSMPFQEHVVFVVLVRRYWFVFIGIRFIKSVSCMWNLLALDFYDILKILKTFLLKAKKLLVQDRRDNY